jgi:thiosulfate/3-mercaptopyruvate sulfurtransferase
MTSASNGARRALALIAIAFWPATPVAAQDRASARAALLTTPAELASRLTDPGTVLLHVGSRAAYERGHIPGARFIDLDAVSTPHLVDGEPLTLEMPAAEVLRAALAERGVSDASHVVIYVDATRAMPAATRILLALEYVGHGRHALLDGGLEAWRAAAGAVATGSEPARTGSLSPHPVATDLIVDADWVNRRRGERGIAIVDARARSFYESAEPRRDGQRPGHIAAAARIPFSSVLDEAGRFRGDAELRALFRRAGVAEGATVVGYCHIGMQATTMLLAARLIGHPIRLYDGSFEDWSRRTDLPVVVGPGRND